MADEDRATGATDQAVVEALRPLFAGMDPEIVGAVLGQLLAKLIAGHCPEMRDEAFRLVIDMARDLIPIEIEEMIEAGGVGPDWRGTKQ